jgi:hypothetical protein
MTSADEIENRITNIVAHRMTALKNDEKLSMDKSARLFDTENADFDVPNSNAKNIKAIISPAIDINGKYFFCLLKIRSKTTTKTKVRDKIISG